MSSVKLQKNWNKIFNYGTIIEKEEFSMNITAERIKQERINKGLNRKELASKVGVKSQSTITNWEEGTVVPKADKLQKLSEIFEVSIPYLIGYTTNKNEDLLGFDSPGYFEKRRQQIFNEYRYNPNTGSTLKQSFGAGKKLNDIELIKVDIHERYKEVANNLATDLSDENNEKWLEYGRLLIQEQNRNEDLK
ncbi:XRE family transcriptional regulator [Lactococcus lactis subsp. lactis]|nr:XRE family transcriptional regulator [Lactococcus lactis subsp. lactis]